MGLRFDFLRNAYRGVAIIFFNTAALLFLVNLALGAVYFVKDRRQNSRMESHGPLTESGHFYKNGAPLNNGKRRTAVLAVFDYTPFEDTMSEEEISRLLDEDDAFSKLGFPYEPWVQYGEPTFAGEFINVGLDETGIPKRRTPHPPATAKEEPPIRIFALGGSTTFGLKLADRHSYPAYLARRLNDEAASADLGVDVEVSNYGRRGFYPTQELHLLIDLLRSGHRPAMVIFLDGVNLGGLSDTPNYTALMQQRVAEIQFGSWDFSNKIPLVRLANSLSTRFRTRNEPPPVAAADRFDVAHLVERFEQFKETATRVCEQYGVEPLFVLQPDAPYNYPVRFHRTGDGFFIAEARELRKKFYAEMSKKEGYLDLTGLFGEFGRKSIIDAAHYSPPFNEFVAERLAQKIDLKKLKQQRQPSHTPTGAPRVARDD